MKIAIIYDFSDRIGIPVTEKHVETVRKAMPDAEVRMASSGQELIDAGFDADILICWVTGGGLCIVEDYCRWSKNLKWIHGLSAGVEGVTQTSIAEIPGLRLTNAKGIHGIPISETVMGYLVSTMRMLPAVRENQKKHQWIRLIPEEMYGKTVTILGIGSIGQAIAKRCKAFDMTVLGVKRSPAELPNVDEVLTEERMDEAISRADIVVMVLPATAATEKIFGAEKFALMKEGALFVNVGRGQTVDTDALVDALASGRLGGAMLDALDPEPLPEDHPLWDMENVVISPHMSAQSMLYMDRAFEVFADNVPGFLRGEVMPTEIDLKKY